ncbi:hypothetical protein B4903_23255, partial [Yersinia frederiksenii]
YFCLLAPEKIDLYNIEDKHFNDTIASISIPNRVQVTIYKNDNFNSPHYNLTESINLAGLEKINMLGSISSIEALDSPSFCEQHCVVMKENKIVLTDFFSQYPAIFGNVNNIVLMNFNINNESNFSVDLLLHHRLL